MLVSISIENFRSFSAEQTLNLVASNRPTGHLDHLVKIPNSEKSVLHAAIIYGANGAGKSNIFKALSYIKNMALKTRAKEDGTARDPFRLSKGSHEQSGFDIQIVVDNQLFRFGFNVNDEFVCDEWLVRIVKGSEKVIYERTTSSDGSVNVKLGNRSGPKLSAISIVGGPPNQTFLATVLNNLSTSDYGPHIGKVKTWFNRLTLVSPGATHRRLVGRLADSPGLLAFVSEFLADSSTGVTSLQVKRSPIDAEELESIVPYRIVEKVLEKLDDEDVSLGTIELPDGREVILSKNGSSRKYEQVSIAANHVIDKDMQVSFDLKEESDGTRRLIHLIPAVYNAGRGPRVFFIDEVDRSMHPVMVRAFVEAFLKSCLTGQGQMIMTTHESSLLDLELIRRDEIWFVEKDLHNSTSLYSLSDFHIRKDLEIRKHYIQGRFGAIPFVDGISRLIMLAEPIPQGSKEDMTS